MILNRIGNLLSKVMVVEDRATVDANRHSEQRPNDHIADPEAQAPDALRVRH